MTVLIIALLVGAGLFGVGLYGALSQTNLVMIMMGIELILGGALVNLVAFWRFLHPRRLCGADVRVDRDDGDGVGDGRWFWGGHGALPRQGLGRDERGGGTQGMIRL